jgi:hypothetical protein
LAQLTPPGVAYPTSVWLMSLDASTSVLRQVTPNGLPTETRADAEIVPLATGAMVVYSKFDNTKCPDGTDGSWLCLPGAMGPVPRRVRPACAAAALSGLRAQAW